LLAFLNPGTFFEKLLTAFFQDIFMVKKLLK